MIGDPKTCAYCDATSDLKKWVGYTSGAHFFCPRHYPAYEMDKEGIIELQLIDADCNDCRHFERGKMAAKGIFDGHCAKYDRPTRAYPGMATGMPCFEHRRLATV